MKTTPEWLDAAKAKHLLSDYALAPRLGITRSQMSRYRNGADFLSDDAAIKLAELLGMETPAEIIASAHAERAKSDEARAFWADWAQKLGGVAASILLTAGLGGGLGLAHDAKAAERSQNGSTSEVAPYTSYKGRRRNKGGKKPASWMDGLGSQRLSLAF